MPKRVIAGKGACKHPNGRGKPSREFTIDGVGYYFCYGWTDDWGDGTAPQCEDCPAHINVADDVWYWNYCTDVRCEVGEVLDCECPWDEERIYDDREEFEEDLWEHLSDHADTVPELEEMFKRSKEDHEQHWHKAIIIRAEAQMIRDAFGADDPVALRHKELEQKQYHRMYSKYRYAKKKETA